MAAIGGTFGAVCYRAGRNGAENKKFKIQEKENAKVDFVLRNVGRLNRAECLEWLRGKSGKK